MNALRRTLVYLSMPLFLMSFSQCASSLKLQESTQIEFGKPYYQSWVAGIEGGGSGTNLFIPVIAKPENVTLDSVYFKGKKAKLEKTNSSLYAGRFKNYTNSKKEIIMSNEPHAEYGNEVPKIPEKLPFPLEINECIVVYTENNKTKYFKISNIIKQEPQFYPQAPKKD